MSTVTDPLGRATTYDCSSGLLYTITGFAGTRDYPATPWLGLVVRFVIFGVGTKLPALPTALTRKNDATALTTVCCSDAVISGKIGKAIVSIAARCDSGRSCGAWPNDWKHSCMCIGTG